jgi:two-component system, NarL family, nitrate/nitrite response regulator NarP
MSPHPASPRIEIALADKNPLVLSGLSEVFDRDERFSLVATVATAERFIETVARVPVAIGVIGWVLPKLGGSRVLEVLRERPDAPRIVVYSAGPDPDLPRKVMAAGGAGFCSKSETPDRLKEIVLAVARGQMMFPFVDVRLLGRDAAHVLTAKERQLLTALAKGRTNIELAADLGISVNTVKFHLRNLYDKLSLRNRAEAVAFYYSSLE